VDRRELAGQTREGEEQKSWINRVNEADLKAEAEDCARRLLERGSWASSDLRVYPETAADMLSVTVGTLANWRSSDHPLPFVRGARTTYRLQELIRYIRGGDARAA
jgi:hypothetical protein